MKRENVRGGVEGQFRISTRNQIILSCRLGIISVQKRIIFQHICKREHDKRMESPYLSDLRYYPELITEIWSENGKPVCVRFTLLPRVDH